MKAERSGGNDDGWCCRGRMLLEGGVSDRRRSDRWRLSDAGDGAASLLTCPYSMRAAPERGQGARQVLRYAQDKLRKFSDYSLSEASGV